MPARDGTNKILRAALPALTSTCYLYPAYGQSNSDGTNGLMLVNSADPSMGAAACFGRDGSGSRDGTTSPTTWVDQAYPPSVFDYSALPSNTIDEPFRAWIKEPFFYEMGKVLNARQIKATGQRHFSRFATFGQTGYTIARLIKGTNTYTNLINGCLKMYSCAVAQGYTPIFAAVPYIQGEADFATSGSGYAATLATLQANIESDLKAISGQSQSIPMFITQQSNFCNNLASGIAYPVLDQLAAHIANPGKIILACPMYQGETDGINSSAGDLHYRGHQGIRWGAAMGNAIATVIIDQQTWEPIRPKLVSRTGNVITVQFYVPKGQLVLDTKYVTNLADGNYGFDYRQTGGSAALPNNGVTQIANDTLQFTLSGSPDGTGPYLRAGANLSGAITSVAGFRTGARTCLRDSADPDPRFCNFGVHFDQPII